MHHRYGFILLLFYIGLILPVAAQDTDNRDLTLWFNNPAKDWNEALPVGNGRLGAMIFGGISKERLQLNEETIWTGRPVDFVNPQAKSALPEIRKLLFAGKYAEAQKVAQEKMMGDKKVESTYQTMGDLTLDFGLEPEGITDYQRKLDLKNAVATVRYTANKIAYTREVFSSAADQVLVIRLTADKSSALSFRLALTRPGNKATVSIENNEITMYEHVGNGNGVKLVSRVKILTDGGSLTTSGKDITVEKANTVTILLTSATDYWGKDPAIQSAEMLASAAKKQYEDLKNAHIADYQQYFNRVDLDLGKTAAVHYPTDTRLVAMQSGVEDPQLLTLYYQFGRYLLISSSRPGGLPANLQGIWADGLNPPWDGDYHININIQMNYWLSETSNLSELHMPYLEFIKALVPDGRKTARDMYGLSGAVAHFTTDAWHFTETYGRPQWAMWPMGMAWSTQHLWEHYQFTGDERYLEDFAYPLLKASAEFCAAWLVKDPSTKKLVSGPSISPENTFKTKDGDVATMVMGPTMDHMIIRELLTNTIAAAKILRIDASFQKKFERILSRLAPTRIGQDGRIMEWTEEFAEPEPGHRHISHLYGLHPGNQITHQKNPALLEAARKTLAYRLSHGGGHTGWSRAWIVNFYARLHDGDNAYKNLQALLQKSTLPNLFDTHPPFQIDGNFGATAGVTEMLLQSHAGEIQILPALPNAWNEGHLYGVCARDGFVVDIDWADGKLKKVQIHSKLGKTCMVRYGDKVITLKTEKGKLYSMNGQLDAL